MQKRTKKKKIAFIIDTLNKGGTEKATLDLVNSLDESKYDITLIRFYPGGFYNRQVKSHIKNKVRYPFGELFNWNKKLKEKVNWRGRWLLGKLPAKLTHKFLIGDKYDVEVACGFFYPTKLVSAAKKAKKISWVHMDYTVDKSEIGNFSREEGQLFFKDVGRIVCVSRECEEKFNQKFDLKEKTCFCYNIVNADEIIKKSQDSVTINQSKRPSVIAVGRLTWQKGFDRLLEAHKNIIKRGISHHLRIIGEGEDKKELLDYIKNNKLENSVELLGYIDNPYPYIKNADVFVCSSRHESYGLAVAESIILETPVVTTDCAGPKELLGENSYELIVNNSEEGIEKGLIKILSNRNYYDSVCEYIKTRKTFFDKGKLIKEWENIFDED